MTERSKIKDAEEFISKLDESASDMKPTFAKYFDQELIDSIGDEWFERNCRFIEMQILSQYEDRALALETFRKMDEARREAIIKQLLESIESLKEELGRREKGIFPEKYDYYGEDSTEDLQESLKIAERFKEELGFGDNKV